jgi:hypothetical protein
MGGTRSHVWPPNPCPFQEGSNGPILVGSPNVPCASRGTAPGLRPSAPRQADGPPAASGGAAGEPNHVSHVLDRHPYRILSGCRP